MAFTRFWKLVGNKFKQHEVTDNLQIANVSASSINNSSNESVVEKIVTVGTTPGSPATLYEAGIQVESAQITDTTLITALLLETNWTLGYFVPATAVIYPAEGMYYQGQYYRYCYENSEFSRTERKYDRKTTSTDTYAQLAIDVNKFGFLNHTETSIGFDGANLFTLTDKGAGWYYYRSGIKHYITGTKTVTVATPMVDATLYYIYIDSTIGTLVSSTIGWTLADTKVPVATVYWDNTLTPKFILCEERHTCKIDREYHRIEHFTEGTKYMSGGTPSGQVVGSTTESNKTFGLTSTQIADEDLSLTLASLTDPSGAVGAYYILYRTSTTKFVWLLSDMPFKYSGAGAPYGYIEYDNGSGVSTASANNRFVNTYLICCNACSNNEVTPLTHTAGMRYMIVQGRGSYNSLILAQGEAFKNFVMTGLPVNEAVAIYQFTWQTGGVANSVKGRCTLAALPIFISSNVLTSTVTPTTPHNSLIGKDGGNIALNEFYHLPLDVYTMLMAKYKIYSALLSQNAPIPTQTSGVFIIGQIWTITTFVAGDDFSNMELISGTMNTTGAVIRAILTTPTVWANGSDLAYDGAPYVVSTDVDGVLNPFVNTIGAIVWSYTSTGVWKATLTGAFLTGKVYITPPQMYSLNSGKELVAERISDNVIQFSQLDGGGSPVDDLLITILPIEIKVYY